MKIKKKILLKKTPNSGSIFDFNPVFLEKISHRDMWFKMKGVYHWVNKF